MARGCNAQMMIYLDNCATTPLDPAAVDAMCRVMRDCYGNPSSIHAEGRRAAKVLADARQVAADSIGARAKEIVFTSSGTEANNLVISSVAGRCARQGLARIVTTTAEHASIYGRLSCESRQHPDHIEVTYVSVAPKGRLQPDELRRAIRPETKLLSVLHCNNETGVLQDLDVLVAAKNANPRMMLHLDIVQSYLKVPFDVRTLPVDFLTTSAHKIYGPKGAGFVYVREGTEVEPILVGGAQENFRRAGTENVAAAAGFAEAIRAYPHPAQLRSRYKGFEDMFFSTLRSAGCTCELNGPLDENQRLPGTFNLYFPGVQNKEDLLIACDLNGVMLSSASACHSGVVQESHVLKAMGFDERRMAASVRVCFNKFHTESDIVKAARIIASSAARVVAASAGSV